MIKANHIKAAYSWTLAPFDSQNNAKAWTQIKNSRYPFKMLRYWFMYHMIREESERLGRSLNVAEIGIDKGQMLYFMRDAEFSGIQSWAGIDIEITPEAQKAGYTELIQADVESQDFFLRKKCDVIILLHVLEHLYEPEIFFEKMVSGLTPGGIIIGGFPVMPHFLIRYWQKRLRIILGENGHVSAFSPQRLRKMANDFRLNLEFLSGAFICRKSGSMLEQSRLWMRFNLLYGALFFKSLGSEAYWLMRKGHG
jgi:SAM-dependent methyltransferase